VASQAALETDIAVNGVTPEKAKLLFSIAIAPLPGVTVPPDVVRDRTEFDGTLAVGYLYKVWEFLTPEQRHAAAHWIQRSATAPPVADDLPGSDAIRALFLRTPLEPHPQYDYKALLQDADDAIASRFGLPEINFLVDVDYDLPPNNGKTWAATLSWWRVEYDGKQLSDWHAYVNNACHISVFDQRLEGVDRLNAQAVMTHEMFHCYQQRAIGDAGQLLSVHNWVTEGTADWVMADIDPKGEAALAGYWDQYAKYPSTAYADRSYDAIGVFGHLSDMLGDQAVIPRLLPVVTRAVGGDDGAAFGYLIQGNETEYLNSWGSSYELTGGRKLWSMTGPGHPPDSGGAVQSVTINAGDKETYVYNPWNAHVVKVVGNADIVSAALLVGYGRLHDDGYGIDTSMDTSGPLKLCVKSGGCKCPDGSAGASLVTKPAKAPIVLGIESGASSSQIFLVGTSLDDFCKEPDKKPPAPPGGGGGGGGGAGGPDDQPDPAPGPGGSGGDTHITTFDGLKYDFQAIGEYTLVKSTRDDFLIQTRQVPPRGARNVSVNQAMATRMGDRRVTVQIENGAATLRVAGVPANDEVVRLPAGTIIRSETTYGPTFQFTWADGTHARVAQLGASTLNVTVEPAAARAGALAGLLGDFDGSPENDLVGAGGAKLGVQPPAQELTHGFADTWRIAQADSLFDYQPEQSTATFTDPTFPDNSANAANVPNRETAEKNCREMGITDRHLLDNCIVDFAVTSDFVFASSYSHEQQAQAARAASVPAPAHGVLRTMLMTGAVTTPQATPRMQFTAQAGDVVWIGQPDCTDRYIEVGLVDPAGKGMSGGPPCTIGRRVLPASGTYTLRGYRTSNPLGVYHVPILIVRPDRVKPIAYGDVVFGNIETPGAHDVYTFTAKAGDLLRIAGLGCDVGRLVIGVIVPTGADRLGPGCREGTDYKVPESGNYKLVINSADGASGAYHFVFQGASTR
jgi:hypothetical protein